MRKVVSIATAVKRERRFAILTEDLWREVETQRERINRERPLGDKVSRSDVIEAAMRRGFGMSEAIR